MDGWGRHPPGKGWVLGAALVAGQQDPSTFQKRFPPVLCCDLAVGLGGGILLSRFSSEAAKSIIYRFRTAFFYLIKQKST